MGFDEVSAVRLAPRPDGWLPATLDDIELPDTVGYDTETTGLRWWDGDRPVGAAVSWWDGDRVVSKYIAWGHRDGNVPEDNARRWLRDKLRGRRLVGLNLPFDAHQSREWGLDLEALGCRLSDVGHYAALLNDHRTSFSLNAIANDYLGEGKVEGLDMSGGAQVYPAWQVEAYGRQDVALPLRLLKIMDAELAGQDLLRVRDLEDDVTWARVEMERNGARIDVEKLARWVRESQRDLELMHLRLARDAGFRVNPDSREHMTRLFRERGLESDQVTDKGLPSYADAVLAKLAERDPVVKLVRDAAHLADLRSKYLVPYLRDAGRTGILRTTFHQLRSTTEEGGAKGTVSGRFSSAQPVRGEGANLQQVLAVSKQKRLHGEKYLIRELFVAEPGSEVGASDAKQIEYRVFVHLSRSERLIKMYRDNPETDFHATVGDMILKYRPDFDRKRVKNFNFACCPPDTPVLRDDLSWSRAGDLRPGDGLLAFDEELNDAETSRGRARRWRAARVLNNGLIRRECVRVSLNNGEELTCTDDHRWLVARAGWVRADALRAGDRIVKVVDVVRREESWEAGWLAGFFDGEGCASDGLQVNQNVGATLDLAERLLRERTPVVTRDAPRSDPRGNNSTAVLRVGGALENRLELLMRLRPGRLLPRFTSRVIGAVLQNKSLPAVVSVHRVGVLEVAALGTTTQTYVAAGFASHNTLFGAGLAKKADMLGISMEEAEELARVYNKAFPEARATLNQASRVAKERGYVRTALGRRSRFPEGCYCPACFGGRPRYHKALNCADQGTAADVMKLKMVLLHRERASLGLTPRMTVHDEYVGDVRDRDGARRMDALLNRQDLPLSVPILWSTEVGANWAHTESLDKTA